VTFAWIRRFEEALSLVIEWPQSVTAYHDRIQSFSSVRDELEHYKPAMDEYLNKAYP
jgi:glutathione S-transferase/maleylpyruvate isomerase